MSTETVPPALDGARRAELKRLAQKAKDAETLALREPTTTNHIATDSACQELERACTPDVILALCAAPAAGTPEPRCRICNATEREHEPGLASKTACVAFRSAETPPAAEPPMSAPDASPTLGELCGDCHRPIRGTPLFRTVPDGTPYHVACAPYPLVPHGDPAPCECNSCCAHRIYGVAMTCCPRGLSHGANCICGVKSGGAAERAGGGTTEPDAEMSAEEVGDYWYRVAMEQDETIAAERARAERAEALLRRVVAREDCQLPGHREEWWEILRDIRATLAGGGQ